MIVSGMPGGSLLWSKSVICSAEVESREWRVERWPAIRFAMTNSNHAMFDASPTPKSAPAFGTSVCVSLHSPLSTLYSLDLLPQTSLMPQRLHRMQPRGAPRRQDAGEDCDHHRSQRDP